MLLLLLCCIPVCGVCVGFVARFPLCFTRFFRFSLCVLCVGMVTFTGSTATGRKVSEMASHTVKRVTLELGGKAPCLVFADADIEAAAQGLVIASFINTGQDCTAATRIYVAASIREQFERRFLEIARTIRVGSAHSMTTDMGPLSSEPHLHKVATMVENARRAGVRVLLGGHVMEREGFYYEPTVLADAPQDSECVQEEIFGPVVVLNSFSGEEAEGIALANDTVYGLASSVWTQNIARALRVSAALKFGAVWSNDHIPVPSEMPHGGVKGSGYGKDMSHYALEEFTVPRHVCVETTGAARKPWHFLVLGDA